MTVSMHGLDLSWLKDPANRLPLEPKRRRQRVASKRSDLPSPYFMPDVDAAYGGAWKSIIDGSEISSRANWREHNKRNGVLQVDPDHWGKSQDHHVSEVRDRMEFGAARADDVSFDWKKPSVSPEGHRKARKNDRKTGGRRSRKSV